MPETCRLFPNTAVEAPPAPLATFVPVLVIDRPLRFRTAKRRRAAAISLFAAVNAGAEVIADGSIHIHAQDAGMAGASGRPGTHLHPRFEAELVSIAGVYRTFEGGIPDASWRGSLSRSNSREARMTRRAVS